MAEVDTSWLNLIFGIIALLVMPIILLMVLALVFTQMGRLAKLIWRQIALVRKREDRRCSCGEIMKIKRVRPPSMALSGGQLKELEFNSAEWLFCQCSCGEARNVRGPLTPRLSRCGDCLFYTMTVSHRGADYIATCRNCSHEKSVPVPVRTASDSTSNPSFGSGPGSGSTSGSEPPTHSGSGFGGGSSGGGGSGSSW